MHVRNSVTSSCRLESRSDRGVNRSPRTCCDREGVRYRDVGRCSCLSKRIWICRGSSGAPPDSWSSGGRRDCTGDPPDSVEGRGRVVGVSRAQTDRIDRQDCTCVPPGSVTPRVAEIDGHGCLD